MSAVFEIPDMSLERGGKPVLQDVSISIDNGEIVVLLGANGTAVLLIKQNTELALGLANKVFVIERGRVIFSGTTEEILTDWPLQAGYPGWKQQVWSDSK